MGMHVVLSGKLGQEHSAIAVRKKQTRSSCVINTIMR